MRKLAIALALSSTLLATPAFARNGAWYVGGEFGGMIVEDNHFNSPTLANVLTLNHDYGYDGDLFVGYDLGMFRLEAEGSYKHANNDTFITKVPLPGQGAVNFVQQGPAGGSTSALAFMVNGMLDFGDDAGISGFVGGGAGIARVKESNARVFSNQPPFLDTSDSRFAWQLFAGVRQAVTDTIDITVKYRFFNVPNVRLIAFNGQQVKDKFRSHSLLGGITFNFGAPPPPVAVGPFMVFFDWDKSDITPQAAAILDNAAASYQQTGQAQIMLAGHTDRSGSDQYNMGLGQRRADSVKAYLAGHGIPEGVMTTQSFGESRPLVETADGVREPQNRRVEITFGPGSGQ